MQLTVFCLRRDRSELTFSLEVDPDFELQNFRALCELESGVPARESTLMYAEQPLTDNQRSLASYGLKDGDVVVLRQENSESLPAAPFSGMPRIDFSSIAVPGSSDQQQHRPPRSSPPDSTTSPQGLDNPAMLREMLLSNPHELSLLKERNPPLAEALLSGDLEKFTRVLVEQQQERARREQERIRLFSADPFDIDAQARIEEDIRQQNIEENMTIAMEEAPESFGQVVMLYINCKVNGYPVKAFVDSGAQMTIMSQACAERCHIMRLVDRRWAGIAKGVGTQKIIGRVHLAQVQIEGDFLPCSFSILEEQPMDMLLGLDMLKRHQCSIDLKNNFVLIGTTGTRTAFLPEGELPECARLAYGPGREDMQPEELADQELAEALQKSVDEAEHGDEETTSLEMPSLPTTDVLIKADNSSGLSFNPPGPLLDRSVSAPSSVCIPESNAAENIEPQVVELSENATACPASAERATTKDLFDQTVSAKYDSPFKDGEAATHNLAGDAACCKHAIPLQNILQDSRNLEGACAVEAMENDFHIVAAKSGEGLMASAEKSLVSEHLEISQKNLSSNFQEPDLALSNLPIVQEEEHHDQILTRSDGEPLFHMEHVQGLDGPHQGFHAELSGELQKTHLQQNKKLLASGEENTEPQMEIDNTVHSLGPVEEMALTGDSDTNGGAIGFDQQWSEVDMPEVDSSNPGSLKHPLSPGGVSECIRIDRVDTDAHKPQSLSPYFQSKPISHGVSLTTPDIGTQGEEPGESLASALKELHKLLIVNSKEGSKIPLTEAEACDPSDLMVEVQAERIEGPEKAIDNKILITNSDNLQAGELENAALGDTQLEAPPCFTPTPGSECSNVLRHNIPATMDVAQPIQELDQQDIAIVSDSAETFVAQTDFSPLLQLSETQETGNDISESSKPVTTTHTLVTDFHAHGTSSTEATLPKMVQDLSQPETERPLKREVEAPSRLPVGVPVVSTAVRSHQFPATSVRRILGAGFSLQEALAALEHAGGNADLALLVLLARNIVVPS